VGGYKDNSLRPDDINQRLRIATVFIHIEILKPRFSSDKDSMKMAGSMVQPIEVDP
jgi:hypothetical protein